MPLYVYKCSGGHIQEAYRSISDRNNGPTCDCGKETEKVITPVAFDRSFLGSAQNPGYQCPVTNGWVDTKRKRKSIMAEHNLVECGGKRVDG